MTTYTAIPDADVAAERPITTGLMTKLRDNPLAVTEGDSTAPSINPAALTIGGKGGDGVFDDGTAAISAVGYYEFSSMEITAARSMPLCSVIRIAGDAVLSDVLTVAHLTNTPALTTLNEQSQCEVMGAIFGVSSSTNGDGGGSVGADGQHQFSGYPSGARGKDLDQVYHGWVSRHPFIGGCAKYVSGGGGGGGSLILIVEGDFDATGGTITADGQSGTAGNSGGGGGGSVIVICTGTITGGTFNARGGTGSGSGVGGGGGYVSLIATTFTGTQTKSVVGNTSGGTTSEAGYSESVTLTRDQIRTILQRL